MQEQYWVIAQLAIDIFMLALLVVLLKIMSRKRGTAATPDSVYLQPENLLKEMKQISETLEKNLEEKRTLTRNIITELEALLSDAEGASLRLEGLMDTWKRSSLSDKNRISDTERLKKSARALLEKGLAKKEIARRLDVPLGELELMLKLQGPAPRNEK
jgi:hypothetical protein